jgi:hypothetical protein
MILAFVDPYVLACPEDLDDEEKVLSYVTRLIAWRDLRSKGWLQMLLPGSAPESIANTNGFPPWEALTTALRKKDLGIQASDVYEVLNTMLNKCPVVEDVAGIRDILIDGFTVDPDYLNSRRTEHQEEFQRLLGIIALYQAAGGVRSEDRQIITASASCPHELIFSVLVVDAEYSDNTKLHPTFPISLEDRLTGVCCPYVATMKADYLSMWEGANCDSELRAALELCVEKFELNEHKTAGAWKIGPHFFESIRRMHLQNRTGANRVLRACLETIFGLSLEDTHAIRESISGNSAQRKRGKDGAMRRDIDHELHLHYWNTSEGPEFAAVVAHNDFSIPE